MCIEQLLCVRHFLGPLGKTGVATRSWPSSSSHPRQRHFWVATLLATFYRTHHYSTRPLALFLHIYPLKKSSRIEEKVDGLCSQLWVQIWALPTQKQCHLLWYRRLRWFMRFGFSTWMFWRNGGEGNFLTITEMATAIYKGFKMKADNLQKCLSLLQSGWLRGY